MMKNDCHFKKAHESSNLVFHFGSLKIFELFKRLAFAFLVIKIRIFFNMKKINTFGLDCFFKIS
jgi:hypothetical protein